MSDDDIRARLTDIHRMVGELHRALVPIGAAPTPEAKTNPPTPPGPPVQDQNLPRGIARRPDVPG